MQNPLLNEDGNAEISHKLFLMETLMMRMEEEMPSPQRDTQGAMEKVFDEIKEMLSFDNLNEALMLANDMKKK